jgi:hypothetical protein
MDYSKKFYEKGREGVIFKMPKIKSAEQMLKEAFLVIEEGKTVEAHTYLVVEAMKRYANQFIDVAADIVRPPWDDTGSEINEIDRNDMEDIKLFVK